MTYNNRCERVTVQDVRHRAGRERQGLREDRAGPLGDEGRGPGPVSAVGQDAAGGADVLAVRPRETVLDQAELPARRSQRRGRVRPGPLQQRARPVGQVSFRTQVRFPLDTKAHSLFCFRRQ